MAAKSALRFPPVILTGHQALAVARGIALVSKEGNYTPWACAIMPDHVHLVLEQHDRPIGQIIGHLKSRGFQKVKAEKLWFEDGRPLWSEGSWRVFLDSYLALEKAIQYVNENPIKAGL